jgi:REP element-mobilizing transposase RayT
MPDYVRVLLSALHKCIIAMVGYLKGRSAIHIHRKSREMKKGFTGKHSLSHSYSLPDFTGEISEQRICRVEERESIDHEIR